MSEYGGTFIVGAPRSGTTLLQSLVAAHSMFYSSPETSFFVDMLPALGIACSDPGATLDASQVAQLGEIYEYNTGLKLPAVPNGSPVDIRTFFLDLMRSHNDNDKARWVEKTTNHARHMMAIRRFFPRARFIHIIRDPVDSIASMKAIRPTSWTDGRIRYLVSWRQMAVLWKSCIHGAVSYPEPDRVHHLHYEDLLSNPEAELRKVFEFLDAPWEPQVLEMHATEAQKLFDGARNPWQQSTAQGGLRPSDRHKWRTRLPRRKTWLVQYYVKDLARYLGYYDTTLRTKAWTKAWVLIADFMIFCVSIAGPEAIVRRRGTGVGK
jgi:hypothetical protein